MKAKSKRTITKAIFNSYGSGQRSMLAPFETGYCLFSIGGHEYFWWNEAAERMRPFDYGMVYDLDCIVTVKGTLQRVKIHSGPHPNDNMV